MNRKKTKTRIKIFVSLIASLAVVMYSTPKVFLADSPDLNPGFLAQLKIIPYTTYAYMRYPMNEEARNSLIGTAGMQTVTVDNSVEYRPVANGVYAAQDPETGETIVKLEGGTELEVKTIKTDNGGEIKVYVPIR